VEKKTATVEFISAKTNLGAIRQAIAGAGYDADSVKRNEEAYNHLPECCK
jgi:mercuric ion binding protein